MPKRNKNKRKQISQIKYITKRLMTISFEVDKYIYRNKQISIEKAEIYLQEVMSYKALCFKDARLLQVIEKQTRHMKAIIGELKTNISYSADGESLTVQNQSTNNYSASPVYSLADEDRTLLIENIQNDTTTNDCFNSDNDFVSISTNNATTTKNYNTKYIPADTQLYQEQMKSRTTTVLSANIVKNQEERKKDKNDSFVVVDLTLNDKDSNNLNLMCSQSIVNNLNSLNISLLFGNPKPSIMNTLSDYDRIANNELTNNELPIIQDKVKVASGTSLDFIDLECVEYSQSILNNIEDVNIPHRFLNTKISDSSGSNMDHIVKKNINVVRNSNKLVTCNTNNNFKDQVIDGVLNNIEKNTPQIIVNPNVINTSSQNMGGIDKKVNNFMQDKEIPTSTEHVVGNAYHNMFKIDKELMVQSKSMKDLHVTNSTTNVEIENPMHLNPSQNFKIQDNFSAIVNNNKDKINKAKKCSKKSVADNKKKRKEVKKEKKAPQGKKSKLKIKNSVQENRLNTTENRCNTFTLISDCRQNIQFSKNMPQSVLKSRKLTKGSSQKNIKMNHIEVDLTWVENITYVREISTEEYDPKLNSITDTFWENCLLPENWDDGDFDF